jgi:tRNA threonylcarbamoyladenosine biosynthesis protein TsaE
MISKSLKETQRTAQEFAQNLTSQTNQARVIELVGDLGSGKTTFTKYFAEALGVQETLISPTFVIQKRYTIPNHQYFKTLIHIDAYRLEKQDEILRLNWQEDLQNPENLILVEWSEKIHTHLPESTQIHFTFINETTREIQ